MNDLNPTAWGDLWGGVKRSNFNFFITWSCSIGQIIVANILPASPYPPAPTTTTITITIPPTTLGQMLSRMRQRGSRYFARRPLLITTHTCACPPTCLPAGPYPPHHHQHNPHPHTGDRVDRSNFILIRTWSCCISN